MKSEFAKYFALIPLPSGNCAIARLNPCPPEIEREFIQHLKRTLAKLYPHYEFVEASKPQINQLFKGAIASGGNDGRNN